MTIDESSVSSAVNIPQPSAIEALAQSDFLHDRIRSLQQSARELMTRGYFIFPCEPEGKVPLGSYALHGFKSAGNDESALRAWNDGVPANIAPSAEHNCCTAATQFLAINKILL